MYERMVEYFGYNNPFTSKELYNLFKIDDDTLNENTFRWRIYNLKKQGKISSIARGVYILEDKIKFEYKITARMKRIYNLAYRMFPDESICIWSTKWLNEYMNHQPMNHFIILEVDRDIIDIIFQELKNRINRVYLNPKIEEINNYILDENAIIVKPIIKEVPLTLSNKVKVPKVEKLLVDLFFESNLLIAYQGKEMVNIFENIFERYSINITTLYRYAKNRGIREKIESFLLNNTNIDDKYLREVKE